MIRINVCRQGHRGERGCVRRENGRRGQWQVNRKEIEMSTGEMTVGWWLAVDGRRWQLCVVVARAKDAPRGQ